MANTKSDIVKEYLAKYPDHPTKSVADAMYGDYPSLWTTPEAARAAIRYYRGQMGDLNRSRLAEKEHMKPVTNDTTPYRWGIPAPLDNFGDSEPITLRSRKVLVLSDIHSPHHDVPALEAAINYGLQKDVTAVILNGDILDFFANSKWDKDPRLVNMAEEVEIGRGVISALREAFKGKPMYFKIGNHEERWQRYLSNKAPELLGVPDFEIEKIFRLDDLNIHSIGKRQHLKVGGLNILHGHEFGRSIFSPVNPARGLFNRSKTSALIGHYHQTSEHIEKDMNDVVTGCFSTGCLCDMRPDYARYNKWNHGFAVVESGGDDEYSVRNLKIFRGRVAG